MRKMEKQKKIVFIDDDEQLVGQYMETLRKKSLDGQLLHFKNGAEGIRFLKEIKRDSMPDYILLDLYMPEMDGFEFLEKFDKLKNIHDEVEIYVCTSSKNKEDRDEVMNYPFVNAFLEKPLSGDFLEMLLKDH